MKLPDISEYYKGDKVAAEEKAWASTPSNLAERKNNLHALGDALRRSEGFSVLELCCGTGWIPLSLPPEVEYTGVDNNAEFLRLARSKNKAERHFFQGDIRRVSLPWLHAHGTKAPDIVCCFAALKHFGLHEWDGIFGGMLDLAPTAVFDVQLAPRDVDDGKEFHHVSVTLEHVERLLAESGRVIRYGVRGFSGMLGDGVTPMSVKTLVTGRK